ncbi:hypothetical protein WJX75_008280 [Coccomyxa subellipsoidea]|uniref:Uncharacterized protein n=1 Tax=Coccomyxa subellipsoidea TaxID=248742 RepID=A0ABR2Z1L9_9CHLO
MLVDPGECAWSSYRLPTGVLPQAYRLTLEAILVYGYNVTGYLEIDISTAEPTQCVVLHAMGMTIDSTTAVYPNGSQGEDAANDTEAEQIFDNIEYRKGGSVLRMLWNYMASDDYKSSRLSADHQTAHSQDSS